MARHKHYCTKQGRPYWFFSKSRFINDEEGVPVYDPRVLLKIILFAYSRGITSSREISRCCEENVLFMAPSGMSRPHFTTIAHFVNTLDGEVVRLFVEMLLVCSSMGLISREMFAVEGAKRLSNASKEWSGTRAGYAKKKKLDSDMGGFSYSRRIGSVEPVLANIRSTLSIGSHSVANAKSMPSGSSAASS